MAAQPHRQFTFSMLKDDAEHLLRLVYAHTLGPRQRELHNAWALFTYRVAHILQRTQPTWQPVVDACMQLRRYLHSTSLAVKLRELDQGGSMQSTVLLSAGVMLLLVIVLRRRWHMWQRHISI